MWYVKIRLLPWILNGGATRWATCVFVCRGLIVPQTSRFPPPLSLLLSHIYCTYMHILLSSVLSRRLYCCSRPYLDFLSSSNSHPSHILFSVSTGCRENLSWNLAPNWIFQCGINIKNRQKVVAPEPEISNFRLALLPPSSQLEELPISPTALTNWFLLPRSRPLPLVPSWPVDFNTNIIIDLIIIPKLQ